MVRSKGRADELASRLRSATNPFEAANRAYSSMARIWDAAQRNEALDEGAIDLHALEGVDLDADPSDEELTRMEAMLATPASDGGGDFAALLAELDTQLELQSLSTRLPKALATQIGQALIALRTTLQRRSLPTDELDELEAALGDTS